MSKTALGELVGRLRRDRGLTQGQLATYAGVTRSWLSLVESGERQKPEAERLEAIARVLDVPGETLRAAAGYRTEPLPERERSTEELVAELTARVREAPIPVSEVQDPASAGAGALIDGQQWGYIPQPGERRHRHIAVAVVGDCLAPRLLPGQRAIVNLDASPRPGEIVLAVHDGETVLKILEERPDGLYLVALQGFPPRKLDEHTRVLGVVRSYTGRP